MKIKTSTLERQALDWAVAKCEEPVGGYKTWVQDDLDKGILHGCRYSTAWEWGGPLIEREKCIATLERLNGGSWRVQAPYDRAQDRPGPYYYGPTPLVAAMRCYVASTLGDEVEIPEELL